MVISGRILIRMPESIIITGSKKESIKGNIKGSI